MDRRLRLNHLNSLDIRKFVLTMSLLAFICGALGFPHISQADPAQAVSVSASTDKTTYTPGDTVDVTITLSNDSDATVHNVRVDTVELSDASFVVDQSVSEVAPHTTKTLTVQGRLSAPGSSSDGSTNSTSGESGSASGSTNGSGVSGSGSVNGNSSNSSSGANNVSGTNSSKTAGTSKAAAGLPTTGDETLAITVIVALAGIALVVVGIRHAKHGVAVLIVACVLMAGYATPAQAASAVSSAEATFSVGIDNQTRAGKVTVSYLSVDGPVVSLNRDHIESHTFGNTTTNFLADPAQDIQGTLGVDVSNVAELKLSVLEDHGIDVYHTTISPATPWSCAGVGLLQVPIL